MRGVKDIPMVKTIVLVLLAALALLLAFAATRPDTFRVERSRVISARNSASVWFLPATCPTSGRPAMNAPSDVRDP